MIVWMLIMFVPLLFWIGNSLADIATSMKTLEERVRKF